MARRTGAGTPFTLALSGTVVSASDAQLQIQLSSLQAWPSNLKQTKLTRTLTVSVPPTATVKQNGVPGAARLLSAYAGQPVVVWTVPAFATLKAERGDAGALAAALIDLG